MNYSDVRDIRDLSRTALISIMENDGGVVQKSNAKPTDRRIVMYGCLVMWVPDYDSAAGFQQIIIPDKQAPRDIKEAAKSGKRKMFLDLGFETQEFETIYRIPKIPQKFSQCILKPVVNALRHPDKKNIMAALRDFPGDRASDRDREKWWKKSFSIVRPTNIPGKFVGVMKQIMAEFDDQVVKESKPLDANTIDQAKASLADKFNNNRPKSDKVYSIHPTEQNQSPSAPSPDAFVPPECDQMTA